MENWGIVLYSESLLLWDPEWFESGQQRLISNVVAHELAHYVSEQ
jgi:aminopeptidase N